MKARFADLSGSSRQPQFKSNQSRTKLPPDHPVKSAIRVGLRYVLDRMPGITRERSGKSFRYRYPIGTVVREREVLGRIKSLAIPPAWTRVWICPDPSGHLQATGRD